ncbi:MAG: DUF4007 family protein [Planctomycetes bacterium]|nr:DUF4007 family protein [Planctomycetota bacterium]
MVKLFYDEGIRSTFGGHEKFVFRHGWLKKGVDAASTDPVVFTRDEALVILGVGKNMVRSIRHWCLATGMLKEESVPYGTPRPLILTKLSRNLLADDGWDPFLEDIGSLWLLHWQLASNQTRTLVWHIAFTRYLVTEFTKKQLIDYIQKELDRAVIRTTEGTVEREVDCCLRTYIPARTKPNVAPEESLDCPLAELGLVQYIPDDATFRFNIGPKASLPAAIFGYALFDYLSHIVTSRRTVSLEECVYQYGSPGQAFKLDENSVAEYLEALEQITAGKLHLVETAGLRQIYLDEILNNPRAFGMQILRQYYER